MVQNHITTYRQLLAALSECIFGTAPGSEAHYAYRLLRAETTFELRDFLAACVADGSLTQAQADYALAPISGETELV